MAKNNQNYPTRPGTEKSNNKSEEQRFQENCKSHFGDSYNRYFLNPDRLNYDDFIKNLKEFLEKKARNISTSQLRNIFSLVKKEKDIAALKRLRPKLAYTYGRAEKNSSLKELIYLMDSQLQGLSDRSEIGELKDFFEAIIAYHKYYGGKD
ncbi:MAG: type III-A CRISPR-associated protein Csm2 [Ignavibacteriaceae bacterium]